MPGLEETEEQLGKLAAGGVPIADSEVLKIIQSTEDAASFMVNYDENVLQSFLKLVVDQLNSAAVHEHTKTRLLLVLNNCAMFKRARDLIFNAIKYIDVNMESSMKVEGTMPFDSELGRMSEHMLVLLCRVRHYKIRAVEVLEFAEGNVQFAVQLLLAILLKEPPYEFELRVNCMTAMLGFSHPTTFFTAEESDNIQEKALTDFEDKINHICKLTKRLIVIRVVAQAISSPHLLQEGPVTPVVHVACMSTMKFITNVYNYATQQATSFRQHIIRSTSWVDKVVLPYICKLIHQIAQCFEMHNEKISVTSAFNPLRPPPKPCSELPKEVLQGLICSLRFLALVTFHMGSFGRSIRFINSFTYDLLRLPTDLFVSGNIRLYAALLQFNVNIDSLAGEEGLPQAEHLPAECTTDSLRNALSTMLRELDVKCLTKLQSSFHNTTDTMLARDVESFGVVDGLISQAIKDVDLGRKKEEDVKPEQGKEEYRLLGDLPDPARAKAVVQEDSTGNDEDLAPVVMDNKLVRPVSEIEPYQLAQTHDDAPAKFRCSLNGHLMKNPVSSPYGHSYEKETLEAWVKQAGQTCPFTGKPLSMDDVVTDSKLALEITQWHIKSQATTNEEADFDVYEF